MSARVKQLSHHTGIGQVTGIRQVSFRVKQLIQHTGIGQVSGAFINPFCTERKLAKHLLIFTLVVRSQLCNASPLARGEW